MSRKPSVLRKPIFGSRRVITAFSPIVLAWLKTALPSTPSRRAPSTTGPAGSSASLGTFVTSMRPSRNATTSVNVPPTSTPSTLGAHGGEGAEARRGVAPERVQAVAALAHVPPAALAEHPVLRQRL